MKNFFKKALKWLKILVIFFFASTLFMVLLYKFVPICITPLMCIRTVEQVFGPDEIRMKHDWVCIEKISPNLPQAVIASEDNRFLNHGGLDFREIEKAQKENKKGKRIRGASTISQQTAKNVFLWPGRSYFRKGLEVYFTYLIEWIWGKERIMEVYLNSIEMGKGIYGAEAVAHNNFGKSAKNLTVYESALIAATLPNPRKFNSAKPSSYMRKRQSQIASLMGKIGKQDLCGEEDDVKKEKSSSPSKKRSSRKKR